MENTFKKWDKVIISREYSWRCALWVDSMDEEIWKIAKIVEIDFESERCLLEIECWCTPSSYFWSLRCLDKFKNKNPEIDFYSKYL